jgi:hypothetical protein
MKGQAVIAQIFNFLLLAKGFIFLANKKIGQTLLPYFSSGKGSYRMV